MAIAIDRAPRMADHFAAFSFVDRITEFEPGRRAVGSLRRSRRHPAVSRRVSSPRPSVSSRRGSRWRTSAFAADRLRRSPTRRGFAPTSRPAARSLLAVDIESCDEHAVAYSGRASVGGTNVIELVDCLGPMLPVEEFDAPQRMMTRVRPDSRRRCACGRVSWRQRATRRAPWRRSRADRPKRRSTYRNPRRSSATIFRAARCFRRRCCSIARSVSRWRSPASRRTWPAGTTPAPARMTHVKMRSFIPPGAMLEIEAQLTPRRLRPRDDSPADADGRQGRCNRAARGRREEHSKP